MEAGAAEASGGCINAGKRLALAASIALLCVALFVGWYCVAANYDYDALSGTYTFRDKDVSCTLVLRADHSFQQDVKRAGRTAHAEGEWRRLGEGGVVFPGSFIRLPGQQMYQDKYENSAPDLYGNFYKILTLYPVLYLHSSPRDLKFSKKLFH